MEATETTTEAPAAFVARVDDTTHAFQGRTRFEVVHVETGTQVMQGLDRLRAEVLAEWMNENPEMSGRNLARLMTLMGR